MSIVRWLSAALLTLAATAAASAQSTPLSSVGLTTLFAQESPPISRVYVFPQIQLPTLAQEDPCQDYYPGDGYGCNTHILFAWRTAWEQGNMQEARRLANKLVELEPANPAAKRLLVLTRKWINACGSWEDVVENNAPNYPVGAINTARTRTEITRSLDPGACEESSATPKTDSVLFSPDCGYMKKFLEFCQKNGPLCCTPVCSVLSNACCKPTACGAAKACCKAAACVAGSCCTKSSAGAAKAGCCAKDCKCDPCVCAKKGTCCSATSAQAQAKCACGKECACCKCGVKEKKVRSVWTSPNRVRVRPPVPDFVCPYPSEAGVWQVPTPHGVSPFLPYGMPGMPPYAPGSVIAVAPPVFMSRPGSMMVPPPPPLAIPQHPAFGSHPYPGLPTPDQAMRDLECVRNLAEARVRACMNAGTTPVAHGTHQVHLVTPAIEAHCERMSSAGDGDHILLEGDVHLTSKRHGAMLQVRAQRLLVNVKDGTFTTLDAKNHVPVHHQGVRMPGCPVEPVGLTVPPADSRYGVSSCPKEAFNNRAPLYRNTKPMMPVCPYEDGVDCPTRCPLECPDKIDD